MKADGMLIDVDGGPALRFERRYPQDIERVWRAVTDPDEMGQWFPANVEGERREGAELAFVDDAQRAAAREAGEPTRADGPIFRGAVVAYDPPKRFVFTWGGERLHFELAPDGEGTRLVFTHVLSHESVAARNGAGWHACLSALDSMLGVEEDATDGFGIYDEYLDRMGPSLGVPSSGSSMTWERATHVDADRVRAAVTHTAEIEAWGGHIDTEALEWEIEPTPYGTIYRLTHRDIGRHAERAAQWHALLLQLDMYLAAGELIPVDPSRWVERYRSVVAA